MAGDMWEQTDGFAYGIIPHQSSEGGEKRIPTWTRPKRKGFDGMGKRVSGDAGQSEKGHTPSL